jgi:hypothetical protein
MKTRMCRIRSCILEEVRWAENDSFFGAALRHSWLEQDTEDGWFCLAALAKVVSR